MTCISPHPDFVWHDGLLLGHAPMDREHEQFVNLIGAMHRAPDASLAAALDAVAAYAQQHFATEDAWMAETDFPPRACHVDEHAAVLASIHAVQERLAGGDVAVVRDLCAHLVAWFPGHAQHLDSALSHWMCKLRLGGKPVVLRRSLPTPS